LAARGGEDHPLPQMADDTVGDLRHHLAPGHAPAGGGGEGGGPSLARGPRGPKGWEGRGINSFKKSMFKRRNRGCNPPFEKPLTEAVPHSQAGGMGPTFRFLVGDSV